MAAETARVRWTVTAWFAGRGGRGVTHPPFLRRAQAVPAAALHGADRKALHAFFKAFGLLLARVAVPGANIVVASNPLLCHIVASAMGEAGLEQRGSIVRLTMTTRGGDRPKNAHHEFEGVSVMPRSTWEPWVVLRRPLDGRVQDNLRRWKTGGFRRPCADKPFGDVIRSGPTSAKERRIAPHPSLKPQGFLRRVVRASLPLGGGRGARSLCRLGVHARGGQRRGLPERGRGTRPVLCGDGGGDDRRPRVTAADRPSLSGASSRLWPPPIRKEP